MNTLIKIERSNCTPCNIVDDYLQKKSVKYNKINIDDNPMAAHQYGITSVPTLILLDAEGLEIDRYAGVGQKKINALINKL